MANLTPKQQRFVEEYLIDLNATQAYIRAGFSEKLANTNAAKLLQNTTIAKAIEDARKEVSEKALITTEMVVKGLLKEAQDYAEGSTQSARVSAWAHLGKHLGMFVEQKKVDVTTNGESINKPTLIELVAPDVKGKD